MPERSDENDRTIARFVLRARSLHAGREADRQTAVGFRSELAHHLIVLVLSALGKSRGIGRVTLPVAAHSLPRCSVVMKPMQRMPLTSWPIGVWNTRPLP